MGNVSPSENFFSSNDDVIAEDELHLRVIRFP